MEPDRPLLRPADLTEDQRALYDEICAGPRAHAGGRPSGPVDAEGRLTGPFNAMLHAPTVGRPLQRLDAALRYESSLSGDVRESMICLVAGTHRSPYELAVHAPLARLAGVPEDDVDLLARGEVPATAGPELRLAHALLADGDPTQAADELHPARVLEVSTLVGYYTTLAWQLRLFGIDPAEASNG